eukprot:TRINITY_DN2094_c0_g1_i1.p1 TRINITY_DN2094_c0_g1~~TRINITY_DN2094_c0_g1_i1.p1  ORF type:complete len:144 (-),score=10.28 TRINITY_DN2094_c0_g1_i1:9-440(-)
MYSLQTLSWNPILACFYIIIVYYSHRKGVRWRSLMLAASIFFFAYMLRTTVTSELPAVRITNNWSSGIIRKLDVTLPNEQNIHHILKEGTDAFKISGQHTVTVVTTRGWFWDEYTVYFAEVVPNMYFQVVIHLLGVLVLVFSR